MTDSFYPDCSNNNWGSTQDALNFGMIPTCVGRIFS
jgi:hypothetical protein